MKRSRHLSDAANSLANYETNGVSCQPSQTSPRLPIFPADRVRKEISGLWHRKLILDLRTATSGAWQNGVEPATVIFELLQRADEIAAKADDQGIVL
jgi:hypothetical protein